MIHQIDLLKTRNPKNRSKMKRHLSFVLTIGICFLVITGSLNEAFSGQPASKQDSKYEMIYWDTVKDSEDIDMYQAYIKKFPNGLFVDLAKLKIKALEKRSQQPPVAPTNTVSVQNPPAQPSPMLRGTPKRVEEEDIKKMLATFSFHEWYRNHDADFKNQFIDNQDGTITDKATGLLWQKSGSWRRINRKKANYYIHDLNRNKFAGRSDWRLPTVEELASLIEKDPTDRDGLYIDPIFEDAANGNWLDICWTADDLRAMYGADEAYWVVSFKQCKIKVASWTNSTTTSTAPPTLVYNYVRAVTAAKP